MYNKIFILSLAINVLFIVFIGIAAMVPEKETAPVPVANTYFVQKESMFEILPKSRNDIIFIGNSITDGCEWSELFRNPNIKNRGISGDITSGVLERIDETIKGKPEKIFICIGINDLGVGIPAKTITDNYKQIIERIRTNSPKTKIYIESILPINSKILPFAATNQMIKDVNSTLELLAKENKAVFIDLYSYFVNSEGNLDEKYTNDGIHLLGNAYLLWKEKIQKFVAE